MQKMEYKSVEGTVFCVSGFTIDMCKEGSFRHHCLG